MKHPPPPRAAICYLWPLWTMQCCAKVLVFAGGCNSITLRWRLRFPIEFLDSKICLHQTFWPKAAKSVYGFLGGCEMMWDEAPWGCFPAIRTSSLRHSTTRWWYWRLVEREVDEFADEIVAAMWFTGLVVIHRFCQLQFCSNNWFLGDSRVTHFGHLRLCTKFGLRPVSHLAGQTFEVEFKQPPSLDAVEPSHVAYQRVGHNALHTESLDASQALLQLAGQLLGVWPSWDGDFFFGGV